MLFAGVGVNVWVLGVLGRKKRDIDVDLCGYKNVKYHTKQHLRIIGGAFWHKIGASKNACNTGLKLF